MSNFASNDNMTALFTAAGEKIGERAKIFPGTKAEWDALPLSEKIKYDYVAFAGDSQSGIVDDVPTEDSEHLVKSGGVFDSLATKANLTQITNPNLLDNPWFTINQRGFTSGNTAGYTVDRWQLSWNPGNIDVSFSNGAITLDATGKTGKGYFAQFIDNLDIAGKVVTASVLLSNGTIKTGTGVMPIKGGNSVTVITDDFEVYYQYGASNDTPRFYITVGDGNSITIKAVKLELGSVSTLAMDTAPNYATELLKCQRYYVRISAPYGRAYPASGPMYTATAVRAFVFLPAAMRTTPQLNIINPQSIYWVCDGEKVAINSPSITMMGDMQHLTIVDEVTFQKDNTNKPVFMRMDNVSPLVYSILEFSADL